jgi:hypothetical protein
MRSFIFAVLLLSTAASYACRNDLDCGFGNKCVKPAGDFSLQGTCVTQVNQFGAPDPARFAQPISGTTTTIESCSFDTDCGLGAHCMKRVGQIYGMCVK